MHSTKNSPNGWRNVGERRMFKPGAVVPTIFKSLIRKLSVLSATGTVSFSWRVMIVQTSNAMNGKMLETNNHIR